MKTVTFPHALAVAALILLLAAPARANDEPADPEVSVGEAAETMMQDAKAVGAKASEIAAAAVVMAGDLAEDAMDSAVALYEAARREIETLTSD